ncbi:hypothetical protein RhiJN_22506 [Ceratobasidium sp. AG-Ba]|nr:hypothetical protein RhiJN_22506 [Ceratobasidium sp. AG-Ba]
MQPKGPPSNTSNSLRGKRSLHTVTSTASLQASLESHTPASQPALSVQPMNRLRAPSGILVPLAALVGTQSPLAVAPRVSTAAPDKAAVTLATPRIFSQRPQLPTDLGQGSIEGSSELYVHSQSKVGGNALQIPENTASLSEIVCQNQRIIELFEESLENKWSTMNRAQIAESEAKAVRFHKELLDS